MPSDISKNAMLAIFFKKNTEAENIYISAKLFYRAIKLNIKLYKQTNTFIILGGTELWNQLRNIRFIKILFQLTGKDI